MKKFLSLLLAVVMTLSLVTISAGATEYKDLTDKDELGPQYQEAVAVLNKIGVITGYDDGSFRPDVKLTRGAAAKIIVSLLIGPEAASNLPNNSAPYPDVPASHTFAGVISFCKTKGIISGYGDGTFKPSNDLTGYAFAKMLLGALGYDSTAERFTGTGWTQNVLSIGQYASLFDRLEFKGSEAVSRKDAALLALNTLKATVVEYNNPLNISVTGDNTNVVVNGGQTRSYKVSNQDYATNILPQRRNINFNSRDDYNTVEFAEEHFVDLRLPHDKYNPTDDNYGRPSAEWTYKKLSIGTFPLEADAEYTTQVIHNVDTVTDAAKVRALDLSGYSVDTDTPITLGTNNSGTRLWVNGVLYNGAANSANPRLTSVAEIADYTDNGTLVQVYVDNNGADRITDVVVVRTQLMEIRRIGADYVSLDLYDDGSDDHNLGFNFVPIDETVNNVETGDDYYEFLSGMKAGDLVAVVPVAVDHAPNDFDVGEAYTPETVTGSLSAVETYGDVGVDRDAINLTVGGTKYNIALWNKDMIEIDSDSVKVTTKDVTLHLDKYGNALLAEDVGATEDWMIIGSYRQGLVNGIVVTYANGWDISGNEVSLNIGYQHDTINNGVERRFPIGSLVYYTNDTSSNTGEWQLFNDAPHGVFNVFTGNDTAGDPYKIRSNSSRINLVGYGAACLVPQASDLAYIDNGIKFIYVTMDQDNELDSIEIKSGMQTVENVELLGDASFVAGARTAQACVTLKGSNKDVRDDSAVKAVVIKNESNVASINNLLYITNYHGSATRDAQGNMVQGYEVAMLGEGGKLIATDKVIYAYRNLNIGQFARYTLSSHDEFEDFYTLRPYAAYPASSTYSRSVAVLRGQLSKDGNAFVDANNRLVRLDPASYSDYTARTTVNRYNIETYHDSDYNVIDGITTDAKNLVNLRNAQWLDLTGTDWDIESAKELKEAYQSVTEAQKNTHHRDIDVTLVFNDNATNDDFRQVYLIIVHRVGNPVQNTATVAPSTGNVTVTNEGNAAITATLNGNAFDLSDDSVEVGDALVVTVPAGYEILAANVTGATVSKAGNAYTLTVTSVPVSFSVTAASGYTLTLTGNLTDATVYDATTGVAIPGETTTSFGVSSKVYRAIPAGTVVGIRDTSDISWTGNAIYNGVPVVSDGTEHTMTLTMSNNVTIDGAPTAAVQTFAVTFAAGITPGKFYSDAGEVTPQEGSGNGVYYFKTSDSVKRFEVTGNTSGTAVYAVGTAHKDNEFAGSGLNDLGRAETTNGTAEITLHSGVNEDIFVYPAVKIEVLNSGNASDPTMLILPTGTQYVRTGATLTVGKLEPGATALLDITDGKRYGEGITTTYTVPNHDVKLHTAVRLTFGNGISNVTSDGDPIQSGTYVTTDRGGIGATVDTSIGSKAVTMVTGTVSKGSGDTAVWHQGDMTIEAAVKVEFAGVVVTAFVDGNDLPLTSGDYVKAGTRLTIKTSSNSDKDITWKATSSGTATAITVGEHSSSVAVNGNNAAISQANFVVGPEDVTFGLSA